MLEAVQWMHPPRRPRRWCHDLYVGARAGADGEAGEGGGRVCVDGVGAVREFKEYWWR